MVSTGIRTGNIPTEVSSLVGRRAESADVKRVLGSSRLVTLTGPGGVGKTRLSLHVASRVASTYPEGVWVLSLADLTQPELVSSAVAATVRGPGQTDDDPAQVIGEARLLLVLDNCEHVAAACAELCADLLQRCPSIRILATSQEPLHTDGEAVYVVPPLPLPGDQGPHTADDPTRSDAVALFLERAAAARPNNRFTEEDQDLVISLCRRLDGLPLAIELAAAATRVLPLSALAASESPHELVVEGSRTAPARHRTIRAALDYSYGRCDEPARRIWQALSAFRGGADLDAIESVCSTLELDVPAVHHTLAGLVDKSIVTFDGQRYRTLETIRGYGSEQLRTRGQDLEVRRAHHRHYAALSADLDAGWFGPDQPALLTQASAELPNLRVALDLALTDATSIRTGLRMASSLWPLWIGSGLLVEGRHWLDNLLQLEVEPCSEQISALWVNGLLRATVGDIAGALPLLEQCRAISSSLGDHAGTARVTQVLGLAELLDGRSEPAIDHLERAVMLERQMSGFNPYLPFALVNLGAALCFAERTDKAGEALSEARTLCAKHGEQLLLSWSEAYLGLAALLEGQPARAMPALTDALTRKRALQDRLGLTFVLELVAWGLVAQGDCKQAARLIGAVEALSAPLGTHLAGLRGMLEWHHDHTERARAALGDKVFTAAVRAGRRLTLDQAAALALGRNAPSPVDDLASLPLTPRERQIAELVALGLTNKEVAGRLVVSPRTVSTHVEHILAKLGFRSRTQIASLFGHAAATNTS